MNSAGIAHLIATRLISLTLTSNRGIEADTFDIQLSDHDGLLPIPEGRHRAPVARLE